MTSTIIEEREIDIAFMRIASTRIVDSIDQDTVNEVATVTGFQPETVERVLVRKYPTGSVNQFMNNYAQLSFQSREKATEFEQATTSIFRDVFGFQAQHIGQQARRPDIVIASDEVHYGAILDSKAYKDGYSAGIAQQNRMRDYIEDFGQYSLTQDGLAFFAYVVSEYKLTINSQIRDIAQLNGVPGSAIAARNIIRMVERHMTHPYTHAEIRQIFSVNRGITTEDLLLGAG